MLQTCCECNATSVQDRWDRAQMRETERKDVTLLQTHAETSRRYSRGIPPTVFLADVSRNVLDTSPTNFPRMRPMYRASGMPESVRRDSPGEAWESASLRSRSAKNRKRCGGKHSARHDGAPLTHLHVEFPIKGNGKGSS